MRENPDYAMTDEAAAKELIRAWPWATMFSSTPEGPVASHYPFLLDEAADGIVLLSHVGKPDELLHGLGAGPMLVVFYATSRPAGTASLPRCRRGTSRQCTRRGCPRSSPTTRTSRCSSGLSTTSRARCPSRTGCGATSSTSSTRSA